MYLLVTHIPIFTDGPIRLLEQGWLRDVLLARDWLAEPFGGRLALIAPWRPATPDAGTLVPADATPGVEVVPAMDDRCRTREFWLRDRKEWSATVARYLPGAEVIHTAISDIYRPMQQLAFAAARRAGVTTVLVGPDRDLYEVSRRQLEHGPLPARLRLRLYLAAFDRVYRHELRQADLALLKEGAVHDRYARFAAHPRAFCHTMYSRDDVVGEAALGERLATLGSGRPLRLVYCGRLLHLKGLHVGLEVIQRARRDGARVEFDVVGSGEEEQALRKQAAALGLDGVVRFLGSFPYGPDLMRRLAGYDLLFYTPIEEDTPRMLYDAYAAGLPALATHIPFVAHRARADRAAVTFPVGDVAAGAEALLRLDRDRGLVRELSERARLAGLHHAMENWYQRRRDWTIEAVERRRAAGARRPAAA